MYCTGCGQQILSVSRFCSYCGLSQPTEKPHPSNGLRNTTQSVQPIRRPTPRTSSHGPLKIVIITVAILGSGLVLLSLMNFGHHEIKGATEPEEHTARRE